MRLSAILPAFHGGEPPDAVDGPASRLSAIPEDNQGGCGAWYGQVALTVASWILLCIMHWENDGLWFPQDPPRHLINGVFLKDYLAARLPPPIQYARSYLIRYPIISPTKYPPGFYLLEAATFSVFVPSPWVAKSLVLGFTLFAALYQVAWLRRFVDREAGYLGAVLPILPCIVRYSHAILLNVPAFALQLPALYHARCWLDGRRTESSLPRCRLCRGGHPLLPRGGRPRAHPRYVARPHRSLASPPQPARGHGRRRSPPGTDTASCMEHQDFRPGPLACRYDLP